ncbi:MAG: deoxyribonuclease IV [Culicoidibacterales bacterium]
MKLKIGSHVSMSGKDMMIGSVNEALSYNANTFMIYTGAPQNTRRKPIDELQITQALLLMEQNGICINDIIVHAPYIINLGNTVKSQTYELAVEFLASEIQRTEAIGATQIVLHPGAHVGAGSEEGLKSIIKGLNEVIKPNQKVKIALETMAGKGTECGRNFEELASIFSGVVYSEHLSVCFDTCHVHDAGYDIVNDFDGVINDFDHIVGANNIGVLHINDSKNIRGASKDRHENIGFGEIGFDALNYIVHHKNLPDVSRILETPYILTNGEQKVAPYAEEIEMLRVGVFNPLLVEQIKMK